MTLHFNLSLKHAVFQHFSTRTYAYPHTRATHHHVRRTLTNTTVALLKPLLFHFFLPPLLRKRIADMSCYYTRHMLHSRSHLSPGSFLRLPAFLIFIIIPVFSCPILLRFFVKNVILHVSFLESLLLLREIGEKLFKYIPRLFAEIAYRNFSG